MKSMDDGFSSLYEKYDTILETTSEDEDTMKTYQNVLRKAGLAPHRGRRRSVGRVLLVAAVLAAAALTAAAAVYRVSDAFRGALDVHGSAKGSSQSAPVVERTGELLSGSQQDGEVQLSLRAAVGDERHLKILVDVTDKSGKKLKVPKADTAGQEGSIALKDYTLTKANGDMLAGSSDYKILHSDPARNQFTLLFEYMISGDTIRGETLQLHIKDIMQYGDRDGDALKMGTDGLYELVSGFPACGSADFQPSGTTQGKTEYLLNVSNLQAGRPLSEDFPSILIGAAAIQDGALYLQGTAGSADELETVLSHAVLTDAAGNAIPISQYSLDGNGENAWSLRFDGVASMEALKGWHWRIGAGEGYHTACAGAWDFTFKVDMEDLALRLTPNTQTVWEGYGLTVTALEISPYTLLLQYKTDEQTALRMFPPAKWGETQASEWMDSYHPVILTMKDGSTIRVEGGSLAPKGGNLAMEPAGAVITEYEMQFAIEPVIDPAQIVSVQIGDQSIAAGK